MLRKNSANTKGIVYMLHENSIENQVKAMRKDNSIMENKAQAWKTFKFMLTGLRDLVDHNEVTPQEAKVFNKVFSNALKKCDPDLYADMERIAKSENPESLKNDISHT